MIRPARRDLLRAGVGLGALFLTSQALAAETGGRKLVVIVLRGAMDGLSAFPPLGDPEYPGLRGPIAISPETALRLDADFSLHPKLKTLHQLALAGQARFAPAAALPQRIRSHFEAQDLLESGGADLYQASTGWLNRAVAALGAEQVGAISIGPQEPLILRGPARTESWSPGRALGADQAQLTGALQDLYRGDPLLGPALAAGLETEREAGAAALGPQGRADAAGFARAAAGFLAEPGGPSVAVLSLDGFDTHAAQGAGEGQLAQRLAALDGVLEGLRDGLGPVWSRSVVLAVTEFGRTARVNGTRGTDHGTASCAILAGGGVRPGGLVGDWPTLRADKLFEARDLAPTLDVRGLFKGVLADHFGLSQTALSARVFPGSSSVPAVDGLIRT